APRVQPEQRVDLRLRQRVITTRLAGEDPPRARRLAKQPPVDEPIVDDDVGAAQQRQATNGHEAGIARPRADEGDGAYAHSARSSRARSRRAASTDGAPASSARRPTSSAASQSSALARRPARSEEHTSELQSLAYLVCRLL